MVIFSLFIEWTTAKSLVHNSREPKSTVVYFRKIKENGFKSHVEQESKTMQQTKRTDILKTITNYKLKFYFIETDI